MAAISPTHLIWPGDADADAEAVGILDTLLQRLSEQFPRFLLISLYDLPTDERIEQDSPRLEKFRFVLGTSQAQPAREASDALATALEGICLDLRTAAVEPAEAVYAEPGVEATLERYPGVSHLSLGLPQVYRVPQTQRVYPQVFSALESSVFDALLHGFAAFVDATTPGPTTHPRTLGRSSFVHAALAADEALDTISRSFDFLLGVSPINSTQAFEQFMADKAAKPPVFRYRPLTVDVDEAKRAIYSVDLRAVEDPVLESVFSEKQHELDLQLTLLHARNTPNFRHASLMQYGGVDPDLLALAESVLTDLPAEAGNARTEVIGPPRIRHAAEALINEYRAASPDFAADVCIRDDIGPGLMVSGNALLISSATRMPAARLDALLQHEVSVHVLTCVNGRQQGLQVFGNGLAGYEGIQEGLGVFAEYLAGGLTRARLRLLGARVVAVQALLQGADFIETWRLLHHGHGFQPQSAFSIATRVHRSGGLTKDAIYLGGLAQVFAIVATGQDLTPFWCGKIAPHHVPIVDELRSRGILRPPLVQPQFLTRPTSLARIARIRAGAPFIEILRG
ncbi:flavohemoglobin expression-modulating QEGLA motif protein [Aerolutibacter daejeonensis]|uniref:flavohemoglobin expression-modulating QEGLA motif protein n=1 Tax=Aerolutibacter daejeonensis TaxID=346181 RepID=UPI0018DCDE22|nr:tyrosine/phenylalanine carboxypeptidase domain-containing protein [Lysobacter daejeonensis]